MPIWLKENYFKKIYFNKFKEHDKNFKDQSKIYFSDHHLSHAASAFYPSPFEEAIILTADDSEWVTTTVSIGKGNNVEIKKKYNSHSLGYYTQLLHITQVLR